MITLWLLLGLVSATGFLILIRLNPATEWRMLAIGLVVAALVYVGFAILGNASELWIATEIAGIGIYGVLAGLGFRTSTWWLVLGWLLHPIWDIGLHRVEQGAAFTPAWYALACASFDLLVAAYIGGRQLGFIHPAPDRVKGG